MDKIEGGIKKFRVAVIILAGGKGERLGGKYKQFMKIGDKPLIFYSIEQFLKIKSVGEIIIVVPSEKMTYAKRLVLGKFSGKRLNFIPGGGTRKESAYNGLKWLKKSKTKIDYVIFHDAARPLISSQMIKEIIIEGRRYGAAVLGTRTVDSISTTKNHFIDSTLNQEISYNISTPHCYRFGLIWKAYEKTKSNPSFAGAENTKLMLGIGAKIKVVEGFYPNIKLTYKEDVPILKNVLKLEK